MSQPSSPGQGVCPLPPAKTVQEEKQLHFSEEQLKGATKHSIAFLDVVNTNAERPPKHADYTLVVLGVDEDQHFLHPLWRAANIRIVPEHALQEVDKLLPEGSKQRFPPETIIGKLKEVDAALLRTYQDKYEVKPISNTDDALTDAEVCLEYLKARGEKHDGEIGTVVLYGRDKPRLDKLLSVSHTLHKYANDFKRIVYLNDRNTAEVLTPGLHVVEINERVQSLNAPVGLFPLQQPVRKINTTGLHWNLQGQSLKMGELVSAANCVTAKRICVETSDNVVITQVLRPDAVSCKAART